MEPILSSAVLSDIVVTAWQISSTFSSLVPLLIKR